MTSPAVDPDELQTVVLSAHGERPYARLTCLRFSSGEAGSAWLSEVVAGQVSFGWNDGHDEGPRVQLLLGGAGLLLLGADPVEVRAASRPLYEGMTLPRRSRALHDQDRSAPERWAWSDEAAHAVLVVYAVTPAQAEVHTATLLRDHAAIGVVYALDLRTPADGREHFGFLDGLSRVRLDLADGTPTEPGLALLPPGELLLGRRRATGEEPPVAPFGADGTLVAIRQLDQDVEAFWAFWRREARDDEEAIWLASKAVGRWPNGMPVSGSSAGPQPPYDKDAARAMSFRDDPHGDGCPFGAHVRRANPREGLTEDPEVSLQVSALHHMMRRGRLYGDPAPGAWYPPRLERPEGVAGGSRGLLFATLVGDLERQFEFVQQSWLDFPKFADRLDEVDPIAGAGACGRFTIPRQPLRRCVHGAGGWVTVRAGGYFLLPSRPGLRALLEGSARATRGSVPDPSERARRPGFV